MLTEALTAASAGDGSKLLASSDAYNNRGPSERLSASNVCQPSQPGRSVNVR